MESVANRHIAFQVIINHRFVELGTRIARDKYKDNAIEKIPYELS